MLSWSFTPMLALLASWLLHLAAFDQRLGLAIVARQPLIEHTAYHCPAERTRHPRPGNRRAGVEDQVLVQPRNDVNGRRSPHQDRPALEHSRCRASIGFIDGHIR